jgi:hypothetical protein
MLEGSSDQSSAIWKSLVLDQNMAHDHESYLRDMLEKVRDFENKFNFELSHGPIATRI